MCLRAWWFFHARLTAGFLDLVFRMLSKPKTCRSPKIESVIKTGWCGLIILLLACGLIVVIQTLGEKTSTGETIAAKPPGDESFRTMSPYVPGGRFGAVHY